MPPYMGGDVARSGELGRMFDISTSQSQSQAPSPASSRRSSGPLPRPSPSPAPSPGHGSRSKASSRRGAAGKEAEASGAAVTPRGRARLGVPFACYVLVAVAAAVAVGAGVVCLVSSRSLGWEQEATSLAAQPTTRQCRNKRPPVSRSRRPPKLLTITSSAVRRAITSSNKNMYSSKPLIRADQASWPNAAHASPAVELRTRGLFGTA